MAAIIDGLCDAISISKFVTLVFMVIIVTRDKSEKDYRKLQTCEQTGVRQRRKAFVLPVSLLVPVSAPGQLSANSGVIAMTTLFSGRCIGKEEITNEIKLILQRRRKSTRV